MRLVAVGRLGKPETALFADYCARLRPKLEVIEIPEARGTGAEIRRRAATRILAAVPAKARLIALDASGTAFDSPALARHLAAWTERLVFAIGGAEGLDASILARADPVLSLGPMTWPHRLVRVMLAEQLYRAQSIIAGHPYHR